MADAGPGGRRRRRRGGRERAGQERPQGSVGDRDYGRERDPRPSDKDRPAMAEKTTKDKHDKDASVMVVPQTKPTIILAKPPERKDSSGSAPVPDKAPVVLMKARDESKPSSQTGNVSAATPAMGDGSHGDHHPQVYQLQRHPVSGPSEGVTQSQQLPRLSTPPEMTQSMKLVDDSLQWCDNGMEMLLDQTDFLVVGVIGLQGTGKSTVMSLIAGNAFEDNPRLYAFRQQSRDVKEVAGHQTRGIDFMVTSERIILLDTQPILSASVLDQIIKHEKSLPPEITTAENCVELQSLQLAAFLFTVCHVVLVIQDWTEDINMLQFIHRAEMLKPPTPSPSVESSTSSSDDNDDFYPQIVFVHNKASREDFKLDNIQQANRVISVLLQHSKLKYKGCISITHSKLLPHMDNDLPDTDVNLFLMPKADSAKSDAETKGVTSLLPEYRGHPELESIVTTLRNLLFSASRTPLAHTSLTEKNWFHYAARTWDGVKKSNLMSEYSRLL
ncbi:nonsense-mediated mRNA decay factor SMG9-like [Ptychodera flava]|uniref:nonsense-mediated mRNA decay factor SMG9-like n=1 Tax=Ptychodera flava TaxID=63121 RepID=UPI00396AAC49